MRIINDRLNGYVPNPNKVMSESMCLKISELKKEMRKEVKMDHVGRHAETEPEKKFKDLILRYNMPYEVFQYYFPRKHIKGFNKNYEIDFAIPELKLSFEINGNFHYDTSTWELKDYYKDRRKYIESFGWKQIDIHYLICFDEEKLKSIVENAFNGKFVCEDDIVNEIKCYYKIHPFKKCKNNIDPKKILEGLKNNTVKRSRIDTEVHSKLKEYQLLKLKEYILNNPMYICDVDKIDDYLDTLKNKKVTLNLFDDIIKNVEILKDHQIDIDFSKKGYINKLQSLFGLSRHGVRMFLKNYMPKFYQEVCYKQDNSKTNSESMKQYKNELALNRKTRESIILNSGIDFTKPGWIKKTSDLLNLKKKSSFIVWLKRNMLEFYEKYSKYDIKKD